MCNPRLQLWPSVNLFLHMGVRTTYYVRRLRTRTRTPPFPVTACFLARSIPRGAQEKDDSNRPTSAHTNFQKRTQNPKQLKGGDIQGSAQDAPKRHPRGSRSRPRVARRRPREAWEGPKPFRNRAWRGPQAQVLNSHGRFGCKGVRRALEAQF